MTINARDKVASPPITFAALTTGSTEALFARGSRDLFVAIVMTGSPDDVFRIEGGLDGTNWDNLSSDDADTTIDSAGTTLFVFEGAVPAYIRVTKVSGSNSAAITMDFGQYGGA